MLWIFPSLSNLIQIIGKELAILMTQPGTGRLILPASPVLCPFPSTYLSQISPAAPAMSSSNQRPCLYILLLLAKSDEGIELFSIFS